MGSEQKTEYRISGTNDLYPKGYISPCPRGREEAERRVRDAAERSPDARIERRTVTYTDWEAISDA